MNDVDTCPICEDTRWQIIGRRTYALADREQLSPYAKPRYRVLFEIWRPGEAEIELTSMLCEGCGFVTYTPRPTAQDVDAKYRFLADLDTPGPSLTPMHPIERQRAAELFGYAGHHVSCGRKLRVLDFGGGDGRLMHDFLAAGHVCDLLDYTERAVPRVRRLGATEADLAPDLRYDLIVACHVIEHVAEPLTVVRKLARHLAPGGTLYVEVPMEIWSKAPLAEEPVTHVNFFTPTSCKALFARGGLATSSCRLGGYRNESGRTHLAVRIIGSPGDAPAATGDGKAETLEFLSPGRLLKLQRYAWMPGRIPDAVAGRLKRPAG